MPTRKQNMLEYKFWYSAIRTCWVRLSNPSLPILLGPQTWINLSVWSEHKVMHRRLWRCSIVTRLSRCICLIGSWTVITCPLLLLLLGAGWRSNNRRRCIYGDNWHRPSQLLCGRCGRCGCDWRCAFGRGWALYILQSRRRSRRWSTMRGRWRGRHTHDIWCSGCRWCRRDSRCITWRIFSTAFDATCRTLLESKSCSLDKDLVPIQY